MNVKRMKKWISSLLTASITATMLFVPALGAETQEETVENFALVVKNGAAFDAAGITTSGGIRRGSGLILGGELILRNRSVLSGENKIYYKPGVTFSVPNPDKYTPKPSKYCYPTYGNYRIEAPEKPIFADSNLKVMEELTVEAKNVVITEDCSIPKVSLNGRGNLIFDIPAGKTLFAKVDEFNFEGAGQYNAGAVLVQGGGTLCVQTERLTGSKAKNFNAPSSAFSWENYQLKNENKMVMFLKNNTSDVLTSLRAEGDIYIDNSITVNGEFKIFGNLWAEGDVLYTGKANAGAASEEFNVLGQVYVPNGLISTTGAARVRGQLIADRAELLGNTTIQYFDFHYITVTPGTPTDVPEEIPEIDIGTGVTPDYPQKPEEKPDYSDDLIPNNPVDTPTISVTTDYAYIYGADDTHMDPDGKLTREQAAAIINRVLYQENKRGAYQKPNSGSFTDFDAERWSYSALEFMTKMGVYNPGNGNRELMPYTPATRGEVAKMIAFSLGLRPSGKDLGFKDLSKDNKYYEYIDAMVQNGYFIGFDDDTIRPDALITRADFVIMFNRIIGRDASYQLVYADGTEVKCPFVDITGHYAYEDLMRATFSFSADKKVDPSLRMDRNALDFEKK